MNVMQKKKKKKGKKKKGKKKAYVHVFVSWIKSGINFLHKVSDNLINADWRTSYDTKTQIKQFAQTQSKSTEACQCHFNGKAQDLKFIFMTYKVISSNFQRHNYDIT